MPALPDTSNPAFHYRWSWMFHASPEQVWPLVSDTQRFNEATGLPTTQVTETPNPEGGSRRTIQFRRFGISVIWDEYPFEWIQPQSFGVLRVYHGGPVAWMQIILSLTPQGSSETQLAYEIIIHPANFSGYLVIPVQVGWISRRLRPGFSSDRCRITGTDPKSHRFPPRSHSITPIRRCADTEHRTTTERGRL